jgi:hypothetical protein
MLTLRRDHPHVREAPMSGLSAQERAAAASVG